MRTASFNPIQANLFSLFLSASKIILLLLVVLYGVYHFTLFHWVMVCLFAGAVLAISARVSGIKATSSSDVTVKPNVVYDGGIVKARKPVSNREGY